MPENYDDMKRFAKMPSKCKRFDKTKCTVMGYGICRLCLLDAMKHNLRRMGEYWNTSTIPNCDGVICTAQITKNGVLQPTVRRKSELSALAGAVRQMMKEEKR